MPKTRILIVDDHRVVIKGIKSELLEHPEFEVVGEALNGRQAVKLAESLRPDIVIMDISMPQLNGIDATLQIKKIIPEVHIIIFTMYSRKEYIIDLFKAGVSGYVLKDDPISELVIAIKAVKRGGTYFSSMAPSVLLNYMKVLEESKPAKDPYHSLGMREREVFQLLAEGNSIKEIADLLCISPRTVETHKYNIMTKLNIRTMTDLIKVAIRKNIIQV